jgi:rhodanese-related sulfurtransferase
VANLQTISPTRAAELVRKGAVLIDIRGPDEYAREHVPGARHHALSRIDAESPIRNGDEVLIFHCRSGARTQSNAGRLSAASQNCETYVLEGGLDAWKKAGLPVTLDRSQPIDIMRQVQIVAGSLVLLGVILGTLVVPGFYVLSGLVGAGLMFAGTTGFCGMARLLAFMPWNQRTSTVMQ